MDLKSFSPSFLPVYVAGRRMQKIVDETMLKMIFRVKQEREKNQPLRKPKKAPLIMVIKWQHLTYQDAAYVRQARELCI